MSTDYSDIMINGDLPNVAYCVHCGRAIVWDDWSYIHLDGWANCRDPADTTRLVEGVHALPDPGVPVDQKINPYDLPLRGWSLDRSILDHCPLHQPIWTQP